MMRLWLVISCAAFLNVTGMVAALEKVPADDKVALIAFIDPVMRGKKVGVTAFGNKIWTEETPGFDVNALMLGAIAANLNREVQLLKGSEVGLPVKKPEAGKKSRDAATGEWETRLAAFGAERQVDLILLVESDLANDWIGGTNQRIEGFGHYSRHRDAAYGVFLLRVFDCRTRRFAGEDQVKQAQMLPGLEWHDSWQEYSPEEKRVFIRGMETLIKESAPALLSKVGLTNAPVTQRTMGSIFLNPSGPRPQSYVPAGNELAIPAGVSRQAARAAIVSGLKAREWVLVTDSADRLVGVHRDGKKEATCTFTFTGKAIVMAPEGHEIQKSGKRVPVEVYRRWHENLKESIMEELLKAPAENTP